MLAQGICTLFQLLTTALRSVMLQKGSCKLVVQALGKEGPRAVLKHQLGVSLEVLRHYPTWSGSCCVGAALTLDKPCDIMLRGIVLAMSEWQKPLLKLEALQHDAVEHGFALIKQQRW